MLLGSGAGMGREPGSGPRPTLLVLLDHEHLGRHQTAGLRAGPATHRIHFDFEPYSATTAGARLVAEACWVHRIEKGSCRTLAAHQDIARGRHGINQTGLKRRTRRRKSTRRDISQILGTKTRRLSGALRAGDGLIRDSGQSPPTAGHARRYKRFHSGSFHRWEVSGFEHQQEAQMGHGWAAISMA